MTNEAHMQTPLDTAAMDPKRVNEWLALAGATLAIIVWFWRHALKELFRWLLNVLKFPNRIESIEATLKRHEFGISTGLERSRLTWNGLKIPCWETDATGMCVFSNDAMLLVLKRRPSDILGRAWVNIIHEDDRPRVIQEWDSSIKEQRDFDFHYRWVTSDQTVLCIHAKAHRMTDAVTGTLLGWVAFVDIEDVEGFKKEHKQ